MQICRAGDNALLLELGEISAAELHGAASNVRRVERVLACIPGHSSLYVISDGPPDQERIVGAASHRITGARDAQTIHKVRVSLEPSCAPDLDAFLARHSLTLEEFSGRLPALRLKARHLGFRGGFAYLDGWPREWAMPRRATPRPRVASGSFGIAGAVAGFYPIDSPGGWNLLGRTDSDLSHAIEAGDEIRLISSFEPLAPPRHAEERPLVLPWAEVLAAPLARVVLAPDWNRALRGSAPGGPFDPLAAAFANRAVGLRDDAAVLECALAGPRLRILRSGFTAWSPPNLEVQVRRVEAGETIAWGPVRDGLRAYLAFGAEAHHLPRVVRDDHRTIRAIAGPHAIGLSSVECEVTPQLDRVGIRLRPLDALDLEIPSTLPSLGMQCGTVQLHPDGTLVAMGPDHPVTGGYLQPMTVLTTERWKLAQLVPGERATFVVDSGDSG